MADASVLRWLRAAALVCAAEAAAVLVMGVVELVALDSEHAVVGITTAIFFIVYAVGLALAARGLGRARSWARAPLLLAQLIQLGLAWSFRGGGTTWVLVLLAVPAVFVAVVLLMPTTTEALYGGSGDDETAG